MNHQTSLRFLHLDTEAPVSVPVCRVRK